MDTTRLPEAGPATGFPPWNAIFPKVHDLADESFASTPEFLDPSASVVRTMFVELEVVAGELARLDKAEVPLTIQADVVRIGDNVALAVPQLTIHARRIEVESRVRWVKIRPTYDTARDYSAIITCGELAFAGPDQRLTVDLFGVATALTPAAAPRTVTITCDPRGPALSSVKARFSADLTPNDLNLATQELLVARCLKYIRGAASYSPERHAKDIAAWVRLCHGQPRGDVRLYAQSRALHSLLAAAQNGRHLVPYLRRDLYLTNAKAIADALAAVESEYHRYCDRAEDKFDKRSFADFIHTRQADVEGRARESLREAQEDLKRAEDDIVHIMDKLTSYRAGLDTLKQAFERGIEDARTKAEWEIGIAATVAGVGIVMGIVSFFCTGNPSAPADAAKNAAKAGEAVKQLMTTWERCKAAFDMVNRFLAVAKVVQDLVKLGIKTHQTLEQTDTLKRNITWKDAEGTGTASTDADWEEFQAKIADAADEIRAQNIGGAREYFLALGDIAIRGRELYRAQVVRNQRLQMATQRELDLQLASKNLASAEQLRDRLDGTVGSTDGMQRGGYYERLATDLKLQLIQAIEDHLNALRYEQLVEPQCPSLFDLGTGEIATALAMSGAEILAALSASPRQMGSLQEEFRIWQGDALRQLRAHGALRWRLSLDFPAFQKYECLHVEEIRVWLEGKDLGASRIFARIGSSADFDNRQGGANFHFSGAPCDRDFSYAPYAGSDPDNKHGEPVQIYAKADDPQHVYFMPTPFTVWDFAFPRESNRRLRYEDITAVWVKFIGWQVRREPVRADAKPETQKEAEAKPGVEVTTVTRQD